MKKLSRENCIVVVGGGIPYKPTTVAKPPLLPIDIKRKNKKP